jgi:outer membrane protein assembly factor BamB
MTSTMTQEERPLTLQSLAFLGFNSRVVALDRISGTVVWSWKAPKGRSSYVAILLDGDRVIASVRGYTYCLDPLTGQQLWANELPGLGTGIPSLASIYGNTGAAAAAAVIAQQQAAAATAGGGG